jgi:hypothetical protein
MVCASLGLRFLKPRATLTSFNSIVSRKSFASLRAEAMTERQGDINEQQSE